jgi:N-acetylmuramoyl-L-alanine amidase
MVKQIQKALNLYPDGIFGKLTEEAVILYQREHGLRPDGVVGPATLAKLLPAVTTSALGLKRSSRHIREIIVHCTATPEGKDFTVADITRWHKDRGFATIGYHYVVYRDGTIHNGRDVNISGAHCTNHNSISIGVCYVGGMDANNEKPKDTRTASQRMMLLKLLKELKALYPDAKIYGHRNFANKACPSFDAKAEYKEI